MRSLTRILQENPRTKAILAVAKENKLDVELVETDPTSHPESIPKEYLKLNPLNKIPTFEGANGFVLTECIAIAVYCESSTIFRLWYPPVRLQDEQYYYYSVIPV